jgi:hypothetical protein
MNSLASNAAALKPKTIDRYAPFAGVEIRIKRNAFVEPACAGIRFDQGFSLGIAGGIEVGERYGVVETMDGHSVGFERGVRGESNALFFVRGT